MYETTSKPLFAENALATIDSTESEINIVFRELETNEVVLIELPVIVKCVKLEHPLKRPTPIVALPGKVTFLKLVQSEKTLFATVEIVSGITK